MNAPIRSKFILVDSSISGAGGHYLEYAEQVFDAARGAGFSCVLVANTAFRPDDAINAEIYPVLPLDMWGHNLALRHDEDNVFTDEDRHFLRLNFGHIGVLWAAANNIEAVRHYAREVPLRMSAAKRLAGLVGLATPIQRRYRALLATASTDRIPARHAEERSQRYHALQKAIREIVRTSAADPSHETLSDAGADDLHQNSARAEVYARAVEAVLQRIGAAAEDVVFIPTLSFSETTAIRNLLARSAAARRPTWSLLFRRDVYRGYTPDWEGQEWNVHALRNLFASFQDLAETTRIKFLCDTEELSRQYRNFQTGPFTTVAIPVRTHALTRPKAEPTHWPKPPSADGRIEIIYRRDARFEHGFDYLAHIFDALPPEMLARMRLSATRAASEPPNSAVFGSRLARARLRPYEIDCYREIAEPSLLLDSWRTLMRLFQIAVFVGPRAVRLSQLVDELDAATSAGAVVVLPFDTELTRVYQSTLAPGHPNTRAFYYAEGESSTETALNLAAALREAIGFCESEAASTALRLESWRLCYVGDARAEKGFALLPRINDRLSMEAIAGRPVRIAAQAYQTAVPADVEMLKAIDTLLRSTADGTVVLQQPLRPEQYVALIAGSDIAYVLYRRDNYTARSSGVFVEAIAGHKPVIATAGTWMSAVMGAYAPAYHREMIDPARVVSELTVAGADPGWREIGIDNGRHVDRDARPETVTRLTETLGKYRIFSCPESADQLWLELETDSPYPDICIHITLAWRDANFAAVREERVVLNRLGKGALSAVLEVPSACEDLWAGFNVAHSGAGVDLNWLRLRWIEGAGAAVLPGGASVPEGSPDRMADAAVDAITTILSNYDAYRSSCEWLARQWAGAQNADQLVTGILEAPVLSRQHRLSGGDW